MTTLFTVIGILGLVFAVFSALFVLSLLAQLALAPFAPRIAKRYDNLKAKLPAGPPRQGHASIIHVSRD